VESAVVESAVVDVVDQVATTAESFAPQIAGPQVSVGVDVGVGDARIAGRGEIDGTRASGSINAEVGEVHAQADVEYEATGDLDAVVDEVRSEVEAELPTVSVDVDEHGVSFSAEADNGVVNTRLDGGIRAENGSVTTNLGGSYSDDHVAVSTNRTTTADTTDGDVAISTDGHDRAAAYYDSDEGRFGGEVKNADGTITLRGEAGDLHGGATVETPDPLGDALDAVDRTVEAVRDAVRSVPDAPQIDPVVDVGGDVTMDDDGRVAVEQHTRVGVDVGDTRITVGQDGSLTGTSTDSTLAGDAGLRVEGDGSDDEIGVTGRLGSSDDGQDSTVGAAVYGTHDGDRVEVGVFRESDGEAGSTGDDQLGSDTGVYISHNDETVRAGVEDRTNPESFDEVPSVGVFVEDTDGDRTGIGVIQSVSVHDDVSSIGTDGLYVDIDGERHDAHATVSFGTEGTFSGVGVEVDPGPVSVSGRAGFDTAAGDGLAVRGGVSDERPTPDPADPGPPPDDEFGSLDDLLPDDLLAPIDVLTDAAPNADASPMDPPDTPTVPVHDEFGDPVTDDDPGSTDVFVTSDGTSVFDGIGDALGDATSAVVDGIGDVINDLFDGPDD
jgi:hypothetical protein